MRAALYPAVRGVLLRPHLLDCAQPAVGRVAAGIDCSLRAIAALPPAGRHTPICLALPQCIERYEGIPAVKC